MHPPIVALRAKVVIVAGSKPTTGELLNGVASPFEPGLNSLITPKLKPAPAGGAAQIAKPESGATTTPSVLATASTPLGRNATPVGLTIPVVGPAIVADGAELPLAPDPKIV